MDPFRTMVHGHVGKPAEDDYEGARLIVPGERGPHVTLLRERLVQLGYLDGPGGDVFDDPTARAVMKFQIEHGVDADSKVGKETQLQLLGKMIPPPITTLTAPRPESENFNIFGDFRIVGWWIANLVFLDLESLRPYFSHTAGLERNGVLGFECHRLVAPHLRRAFATVAERGLHKSLVEYDGCFKVRFKRTRVGAGGDRDWSNHCWGIAVDLNSSYSPLGRALGNHPLQVNAELAACFEEAGFYWGANYKTDVIDSMHFQYCLPS